MLPLFFVRPGGAISASGEPSRESRAKVLADTKINALQFKGVSKLNPLLADYKRKLLKALSHLDYSFKKIQNLSAEVKDLDEESLETWESYAARFSKVVDLFLTKFLNTAVLISDPGFEGTLRDFVNQGEKLNLVDSADAWMNLRELRNGIVHDYTEEELSAFFAKLKAEAPRVLALRTILLP